MGFVDSSRNVVHSRGKEYENTSAAKDEASYKFRGFDIFDFQIRCCNDCRPLKTNANFLFDGTIIFHVLKLQNGYFPFLKIDGWNYFII